MIADFRLPIADLAFHLRLAGARVKCLGIVFQSAIGNRKSAML
jgi:hypothetical protein